MNPYDLLYKFENSKSVPDELFIYFLFTTKLCYDSNRLSYPADPRVRQRSNPQSNVSRFEWLEQKNHPGDQTIKPVTFRSLHYNSNSTQ